MQDKGVKTSETTFEKVIKALRDLGVPIIYNFTDNVYSYKVQGFDLINHLEGRLI